MTDKPVTLSKLASTICVLVAMCSITWGAAMTVAWNSARNTVDRMDKQGSVRAQEIDRESRERDAIMQQDIAVLKNTMAKDYANIKESLAILLSMRIEQMRSGGTKP